MIVTESLSKIFSASGVETTALRKVNLQIEEGEFVAVMGPSGCGKSTLLNVLGLIDSPDEGRYVFMGKEVSGASERQRTLLRKSRIGFVFQSFNLIEDLTILENVELPLLYQRVGRAERRRSVEAVLSELGILHRKNHFPQQLSGGQQQRAALGRAIVGKPPLVLADEPTGNLDSEQGREVMDLLVELNQRGTTVVMVTHSQSCAERAERVIRLLDGRIDSPSSPSAIRTAC